MPNDVRSRVVAVAVTHRRPVGVERLLFGRALGVDDELERLVLDLHELGGAPAPAPDARPRPARSARRNSGRGRSRAPAGRGTRGRRTSRPGRPRGSAPRGRPASSAPRRCRSRRSARGHAGCEPCAPTASRPPTGRSRTRTRLWSWESPSARGTSSPIWPTWSSRVVAVLTLLPAAMRTASKIFAYPVHRQTLPERASRISSSLGSGVCRRRSAVATTRPGVQKPHCTAPASTNASWTRCSESPPARPSTVTTSCPSACAASTRHAHTSVPSRSTEHEPHSPCSQAFFEPGRPSRSRSAYSRLSPGQTSASRAAPLTVSAILIPAPASAHARPGREARGGGRRRCRGRRRSATPPPATTLGERLRLSERTRDQPGDRAGGSERRTQLVPLAIGDDSKRADGDHHRVPRPDLHERLTPARRLDQHGRDQLVRLGGISLRADEKLLQRQRPYAARGRELDRRQLDEERRKRVPGRRSRPEVPAERPAVADLRRADRPRRLCAARAAPRRPAPPSPPST